MTIINLGSIDLFIGMTRVDAEMLDEKIKKNNHGKVPVDKNGKQLETCVSLFSKYDSDKNGVIDSNEYQKYRDDRNEKTKKQLDDTEKNVQQWYQKFKSGEHKNTNKEIKYLL